MVKATLRRSLLHSFTALFLFAGTNASFGWASQASGTPSSAASKKSTAQAAPSSQDLADAKAKGMVWVNTSTHVYHKSDSSMYGTTKRGKFMTEDDAKKAGFRAANESGAKKKAAAVPASSK